LNIPPKPEAEEYYARLFGDAIIEALLSDKALGCKLVAKFSEHGYVRCRNLYVQTRSNAKEFTGNKSQFEEFTKDVAGRLEASYRYLVDLSVWGGELIRASNLSKSMKGVAIVGVQFLNCLPKLYRIPSPGNFSTAEERGRNYLGRESFFKEAKQLAESLR